MKIAFVVRSQRQLESGLPWCQSIVVPTGGELHLVIVGSEQKTLVETAKRQADQESPIKVASIDSVGEDVEAINSKIQSRDCRAVLMVYQQDDARFQKEVFESSTVPTAWVRVAGATTGRVAAMFRRSDLVTAVAAQRILGRTPEISLATRSDGDPDELALEIATAITENQLDATDLVLCGVEETTTADVPYQTGLKLLDTGGEPSIALVHSGHSFAESLAVRIHRWTSSIAPPMDREQRVEFASDLTSGSKPNLEFVGLISASAMLAASGLLQNSAAVIIGAMLIAPLMTPIIGAGLALAQGNRPLFRTALTTIALGFACALLASMLFGYLDLIFQEPRMTDEMRARSSPSPLDFCVGLVGGIAASYARTRSHLSSALAGAAIAAALVPPLSTAGLQIAFRAWNWKEPGVDPIVGPLLLAGVNVLTIMIGSSLVLWARGMQTDPTDSIKDRWTLRVFALLSLLTLLTLIWM